MSGIVIRKNDVRSVLRDFQIPNGLRRQIAKEIQQELLKETYNQIIDEASRSLSSSKNQYINGLELTENSIHLNGWLPNAVEDGMSPLDLKQGFESSPNVKRTNNGGWYLTVPFRIFTPNAPIYRTRMTWQVYRAIRAGRKYNPGRVGERPAFYDPTKKSTIQSYQHKSPIMSGIRQTKTSLGVRYNTFRRVSNNSDPLSWIHKGIQARHLFEKAWQKVDVRSIFEEVIDRNI